jgi:hypothetical protein
MTPAKVVLTLIPFLWIVGMIPFVNRVKPLVLGLPFLAFWLVCGIPVTFFCIWRLYSIDSKRKRDS